MAMTPPPEAPLAPHWAFVVQLREGTALTPDALHGRVEHIMSGQATLFTSLEGLRAFLAQVLTSPAQAPGGELGTCGGVAPRSRHGSLNAHHSARYCPTKGRGQPDVKEKGI
jgi:hypothetical protein